MQNNVIKKILKIILILIIIFIIDCIIIKPSYPSTTFEIEKEKIVTTETKIIATVEYPGRIEAAQQKYLEEQEIKQKELEKQKKLEEAKVTNRSNIDRSEWQEFVATGYCRLCKMLWGIYWSYRKWCKSTGKSYSCNA